MKQFTVYIFCLLLILTGNAQNRHSNFYVPDTTSDQGKSFVRLSLFTPGVIYEYGITKNVTVKTKAGFDGYAFGSFLPSVQAEARFYYGLEQRKLKGRPIKNYSGSFFSLISQYQFLKHINPPEGYLFEEDPEDLFIIGPAWGIQRNHKKFHFELSLGFAYVESIDTEKTDISFLLGIGVGWRFLKF